MYKRQHHVYVDEGFDSFCVQGQLVGVVGKVGSGKSSLLAAITAEMRRADGQVGHTVL